MIYWNKIWSREALHAKNDLDELKKSKILFDDVNDLIAELKIFFSNPQFWMSMDIRKITLINFSKKYALTDKNWSKIWKKKLKDF